MCPASFLLLLSAALAAEPLPWIRVSDDGLRFVTAEASRPFIPWGFNYDHDDSGRLIEDYWHDEWPAVVEDFGEMKQLGANVVRVHLQVAKFMKSADQANESALGRLRDLVRLAEKTGLYLDLTGLGCYHKADVPAWYDELDEAERWAVQARFWEAIARACADSPAIFCYDLMNEPVVPGGKGKQTNWLGPAFAGKHFVQFITRDARDRPRPEIARQWIHQLVKAIRRHDRRHLITVGLVPWSLDRPGLTSGFVPEKIAEELDFVAVHLYPESGKQAEALDTLRGFAVKKPVLIEELFPLKCKAAELGEFLDAAKEIAPGGIGFYWGKRPDELQRAGTIHAAIVLEWLKLFQSRTGK